MESVAPPGLFRHCPRCGAAREPATVGAVSVDCPACGLVYFLNPAVAAAAFLFDAAGRALFFRRLHAPAQGLLAIPGGFLDAGEAAEDGVRRETREEVGLELANLQFLASCPNVYHYQGVAYPVLDLVFRADAVQPEAARALDGVAELVWARPADVAPAELAFDSLRRGRAALLGGP